MRSCCPVDIVKIWDLPCLFHLASYALPELIPTNGSFDSGLQSRLQYLVGIRFLADMECCSDMGSVPFSKICLSFWHTFDQS